MNNEDEIFRYNKSVKLNFYCASRQRCWFITVRYCFLPIYGKINRFEWIPFILAWDLNEILTLLSTFTWIVSFVCMKIHIVIVVMVLGFICSDHNNVSSLIEWMPNTEKILRTNPISKKDDSRYWQHGSKTINAQNTHINQVRMRYNILQRWKLASILL